MVSLAGSQILSPKQRPCAPRRPGCSMRSIRSALLHPDSPPGPSSRLRAAADDGDSDIDNLTDSVIDFRLSELAATAGPAHPAAVAKSSSANAAATEMLDLSRDFSDYSSFNSDISGELERLAAAAATPRSDAPDLAAVDLNDLESMDLSADAAPLECVEPFVLACRRWGPMPRPTGGGGEDKAENAVTALLNLSLEERNRSAITATGGIKPLVYALRTGTASAKQNAACALLSLSGIEENRATIGACGAIAPLVALLSAGSTRGKKDALTTLYRLCSARRNKERAVSAGAVVPLVHLIGERGTGTSEKAMVVLASLASIAEGRDAVVEAGGIPALVETIEDGPAREKEFAVVALLQLCSECSSNRALLVREGAIPPLVALSQSGSARAKHKAETLLGYLREQRQGGGCRAGPGGAATSMARPRVVDLCAGGDLLSLVSARGGRLPEREAVGLAAQLASALAACHRRGVAHRDVKPDNLLFDAATSVLKLADFGSAEWFGDGRPMSGLVGTPYYVAPEVVAWREYGEKVDVWSAGVVLYMMLSGAVPFYGATAPEIFEAVLRGNLRFPPRAFAGVSPEAKDLMRRMLCKDVSRRLSTEQVLSKQRSPNRSPESKTARRRLWSSSLTFVDRLVFSAGHPWIASCGGDAVAG
ncbi:hypothetical protein ZWY2020_024504 [Hordeum vulgare]|nr:hypothetical protein ZWY2020_024504 [Hordeum vulgare]